MPLTLARYVPRGPIYVPPVVDPPVVDPPLSAPSLVGRESFNPSSPTWYDGSAITGSALTYFNGLVWWNDENNWEFHRPDPISEMANTEDIYELARTYRDHAQANVLTFALTGDLRFIDTLATTLRIAASHLKVGYRNHDTSVVDWSASPYRCWVAYAGDQPASIYGTDQSYLNEIQFHALIMQAAYIFKLNIGKTSPGGVNYEDEYNYWIDYIDNDWVPKWQGGGTSSWRGNYKGIRRGSPGGGTGSRRRADNGEWPIIIHGTDVHSNISSIQAAYYYDKLNSDANAKNEAEHMLDLFLTYDTDMVGANLLWAQTSKGNGSTARWAMASSYPGYVSMDFAMMRVLGLYPNKITDALLEDMAGTLNDWFFGSANLSGNGTSNILTMGDIAGEVLRGDMISVNPQSRRNADHVLGKPYAILARWGGSRLNAINTYCLNMNVNGSVSQPRVPFPNLTELLKLAPLPDAP